MMKGSGIHANTFTLSMLTKKKCSLVSPSDIKQIEEQG